jgi:TonB family protein
MLQPSQIEDVSVRYADEIAEVREFFATAGIAVGMPQALTQVAARLRDDRGFHRDLTSHVWVMLHRRGTAVRYGETLGVLAIAAAGKQQAAQADELVAHELLRFVMEAHDRLNPLGRSVASVEAKPVAPVIPMRLVRDVAEPPVVTPDPVPVAESKRTELSPTLIKPIPAVDAQVEEPARPAMDTPIRLSRMDAALAEEPERRGKGFLWFALVAVLLLAAAAGWWMYRRQTAEDTAVTPAPVVEGTSVAPAEPAPAVVVAPEQPVTEAPVAKPSATPENTHHARVVESPHGHPQQHKPELVPSYPQPSSVARTTPPPAASAPVASNTHPATAAPAPATTVAPVVRSTPSAAKPGPGTVSSNALSKQLDHPGLTKEQEAEYDATGRRYPRLLRRTPAGTGNASLAANTMPTMPGTANSTPSAGTAVAGIVRPTSLGVMASNLVYSPAASYPAAASAAHVTGAVKVEAVVDTSGNVAAARVISGPAQLRDAALMAVQQWRYKPYVLGGKARTFTTQALMEFELP